MREQELASVYVKMQESGKTPTCAEYFPKKQRIDWVLTDGTREPLQLEDSDTKEEVEEALQHLRHYCVAKGFASFAFRIGD